MSTVLRGTAAFVVLLPTWLFATVTRAGDDTSPDSLAIEMIRVEAQARDLPASTVELLYQIMKDAVSAAAVHGRPEDQNTAIRALHAIQISLVKHNLVQPIHEKDWPMTMGAALMPLNLSPKAQKELLTYGSNRIRADYLSPDQPLRYLDCDMAAQLFISVGQSLGWDIRLVELPKHNFVRWHLPDGTTVNWDWTAWTSLNDRDYSIPEDTTPRLRKIYLRSFSIDEARGYYLALIASKTPNADVAEAIFTRAQQTIPEHPMLLNNMGWYYATHPGVSDTKRSAALGYALAGWSFMPKSANYADTAACAFIASGRHDQALVIEQYAMQYANATEIESIKANLARIQAQESCNP